MTGKMVRKQTFEEMLLGVGLQKPGRGDKPLELVQ